MECLQRRKMKRQRVHYYPWAFPAHTQEEKIGLLALNMAFSALSVSLAISRLFCSWYIANAPLASQYTLQQLTFIFLCAE